MIKRQPKSFLYAVRMLIPDFASKPIKLGFTYFPDRRRAGLLAQGPFPCEWIGHWPAENGLVSERDLHGRFATYRLNGEWFYPHPDILAYVDQQLKVPHKAKVPPVDFDAHWDDLKDFSTKWITLRHSPAPDFNAAEKKAAAKAKAGGAIILFEDEISELLDVPVEHLARWRKQGLIKPVYLKPAPGYSLYAVNSIIDQLAQQVPDYVLMPAGLW